MAFVTWLALKEAGPWRWILAAGVGLLVLLGLGVGAWGWYRAVQSRGLGEVAEANTLAQEALALQAVPAQREVAVGRLEEAISRYPSNRLIPEAAYHLGNLRYQAKAYEAARGAYRLALAKGASRTLASFCRLGIAYAWEAEGKDAEALAAYQEALGHLAATDLLYEETLFGVARAEELNGKRDRAMETYRRILRDVPLSRRAGDARSRLASLQSQSR